MPISHDLKGLMKFLARDEWSECFQEVFEDHFGPILAGGMEIEDLADIVGDDWAMTLWGCAFEDFLTQDFDVEGGNIVDEYLRHRAWKENARTKAYMKALRTSITSLYEVSEIVPGRSLMARDLIRGGEPIAVTDGTATKTLKQWDRIAAQIVPVLGKNIFGGSLLPFTPQATDALMDSLRQMFGKKSARKLPAVKDEYLQAAAFMFTLTWWFDTLERMTAMPALQNSDGDELVFHDVRFPLASGTNQKDIAARVNAIPGMSQENPKFWNWLEIKPEGRNRKNTGVSFDTTMDNGSRVLGDVELKGRSLHLATNSAARAGKGMALIQETLGDFVRTPLTEIRTAAQMMAERPSPDQTEATSDIPSEIAEQIVHQFLDRQYRETLDQPVDMLGNKTPRQAAKSAAGRRKVADWLKYLENQSEKLPHPSDPMATYNFLWIWQELGVADLRQ